MLRECFVSSSMRLGVPFIAPRQLGAVESIPGRQFLPSVAWRTGQSGAPPDTVRCGFLSFFGEADRCNLGAVGAPDTVRCTPDSPVHHRTLSGADFFPILAQPTVGDSEPLAHQTLFGAHRTVRCGFLSYFGVADRWRFRAVGTPDTVRCTPDSPVPPSDRWLCHASRADYATDRWPGRLLAHRTVWCTTGQSGNV
jgi:hypothetical protein